MPPAFVLFRPERPCSKGVHHPRASRPCDTEHMGSFEEYLRREFKAPNRDRRLARLLQHRIDCAAWWREQLQQHPGGLVTISTAARMLGVSRERVLYLIRRGRLPVVQGCPTEHRLDRFVPVDALLAAPTPLRAQSSVVTSFAPGYRQMELFEELKPHEKGMRNHKTGTFAGLFAQR